MAPPPLSVCLFLSTSVIGGTERMALEFLCTCDRRRIRPSLMALLEGGSLVEEAARLDVPCRLLRWRGRWDRRALRGFSGFLRENHVRLIHNFGLRADLLSRLYAPRNGVERIVSGIRDTDPWRRWPHVLSDRLTARRVDLHIANSHEARRVALAREKLRPEKVIVIHNGIRPPAEPPPPLPLDLPPGREPVIAMVANLKPVKKGHDVLFRALDRLRGDFPRLLVLCAGQDLSGGAIPAMAREMGVGDHVFFTGYCDNIPALLRHADLAVLPSRYESFPASILEAMAAGLPVVASRAGGIPEIIRDGDNGLLVEPGDDRALGEALSGLLHDSTERARLGRAARETVATHFTAGTMTRRIEEAYLSLFAGGGKS